MRYPVEFELAVLDRIIPMLAKLNDQPTMPDGTACDAFPRWERQRDIIWAIGDIAEEYVVHSGA